MDERTRLLVTLIRQEIRRLELGVGERLGSERELAERLDAPRTAVRVALEALEHEGILRRIMGRSGGIFVSDGRIERNLNTIVGVPDMLRQQGFSSSSTVLKASVGLASRREQRALGIDEEANVFRIIRRRDAGETPWSLDTSVIPADLVPGLLSYDLSESLYSILKAAFGLEPREAEETIDVVAADSYTAMTLGVPAGAPLLQIWRTTTSTGGISMEFAHDLFRADRTRVHMHRFGARWKRVLDN